MAAEWAARGILGLRQYRDSKSIVLVDVPGRFFSFSFQIYQNRLSVAQSKLKERLVSRDPIESGRRGAGGGVGGATGHAKACTMIWVAMGMVREQQPGFAKHRQPAKDRGQVVDSCLPCVKWGLNRQARGTKSAAPMKNLPADWLI